METDEKDHSAMGSSEVFRSNNITTTNGHNTERTTHSMNSAKCGAPDSSHLYCSRLALLDMVARAMARNTDAVSYKAHGEHSHTSQYYRPLLICQG